MLDNEQRPNIIICELLLFHLLFHNLNALYGMNQVCVAISLVLIQQLLNGLGLQHIHYTNFTSAAVVFTLFEFFGNSSLQAGSCERDTSYSTIFPKSKPLFTCDFKKFQVSLSIYSWLQIRINRLNSRRPGLRFFYRYFILSQLFSQDIAVFSTCLVDLQQLACKL